ncbi:hypothetical protein LBMAG53_11050 [Planctomycetota bacterium]|nr:hypothetical protein LBMAG53_11050 [Planctomycetota bacterium]
MAAPLRHCRLGQILIDEDEKRQVLFLVEVEPVASPRRLPIAIGTQEAQSIARAVSGETFPRPLTHDLLGGVLTATGWRLTAVKITDFRDQTFWAELELTDTAGRTATVDCRPSDGIALLVRCPGAALLVAETVLAELAG